MAPELEPAGFTGTLLAAMPALQGADFRGTVVLVCAHSAEGAMGLVLNRPGRVVVADGAEGDLPALVRRLAARGPVHVGGPVETRRPFVLHDPAWRPGGSTLHVDDGHALSASAEALEAVASGEAPGDVLVALGYAGWGAGQLEAEVLANVWLTVPADPAITFHGDADAKWRLAAGSLGVAAGGLSAQAGRA
ncbi:YqgE/AlgH family protein [Jannaschia sp. W003]|uniref:YqgE/AlgH family protein n=1 Tax=Jannaschia sp. W003 TaxID=2867012 RepID=UPI0021A348DA|nr:YqgE/AlgH family protein [Jannaschia sp. W003]UWQ22732.1 YqgE/AlgH family protein [Jannaschia sp. W003]